MTSRFSSLAGVALGLVVVVPVAGPAARGARPAAFDARCIPGDRVAPRSNTDGVLARRALSAGRITRLGATPDLHDGLPAQRPVHEIRIEAKKFEFDPAVIEVTAGEPVRLVLHSSDTTHGFKIADLKLDVDIPKSGDSVTAEFTAPPPGRYAIACSNICGRGHRQMKAALVSVPAHSPTTTH